MPRVHCVTHPILGIVSWRDMRTAQRQILKETGIRVCTWCHQLVPRGWRSRCGNEHSVLLDMAYSWQIVTWRVRDRDNHVCAMCQMQGNIPPDYLLTQVDHIIPVILGGTGDLENLRTLCVPCHKAETKRLRREGAAFVATDGRKQGR